MKKILYTATSDIHLKTFHFPYLKWLIRQGYEVHVACENRANIDLTFCHKVHYFPFKRNPFHPKNISAFFKLRKIIKKNEFDLIHCHTPTVSVITRFAAISSRNKGTKVLYTAHGYHFYNGAPLKMWLFFYPLERILSKFTDAIILINKEDYELTKKSFFNRDTFYIKGIGVDISRFSETNEELLSRKKEILNINKDDFILLYVAEFIPRKNHEFLIRSCEKMIKNVPNVRFLFAGTGVLIEEMKTLVNDLKLDNYVKLLGWRDDVQDLMRMADIGISSSKQEGLGLALAEEMYFKLPIVATYDRGHKEMIVHGENGFMFDHGDVDSFVNFIKQLYEDETMYIKFSNSAKEKSREFLLENSLSSMKNVYNLFLSDNVN